MIVRSSCYVISQNGRMIEIIGAKPLSKAYDDKGTEYLFSDESLQMCAPTWTGGHISLNHKKMDNGQIINSWYHNDSTVHMRLNLENEKTVAMMNTIAWQGVSQECQIEEVEKSGGLNLIKRFKGVGMSLLFYPDTPACTVEEGCKIVSSSKKTGGDGLFDYHPDRSDKIDNIKEHLKEDINKAKESIEEDEELYDILEDDLDESADHKHYPWEDCIADRKKDGYTEEQARRICGYIKKKAGHHSADSQPSNQDKQGYTKWGRSGSQTPQEKDGRPWDSCIDAKMKRGFTKEEARRLCSKEILSDIVINDVTAEPNTLGGGFPESVGKLRFHSGHSGLYDAGPTMASSSTHAMIESDNSKFKVPATHSLMNVRTMPEGNIGSVAILGLPTFGKEEATDAGSPFGKYKDFQDCVNQNKDKRSPEAYCGYIKHQIEGEKEHAKNVMDRDYMKFGPQGNPGWTKISEKVKKKTKKSENYGVEIDTPVLGIPGMVHVTGKRWNGWRDTNDGWQNWY